MGSWELFTKRTALDDAIPTEVIRTLSVTYLTHIFLFQIQRVQNASLYRQYMLRKEELTRRSVQGVQSTGIERTLWHGTSADATTNINNGGFNRSYCGKNG